MPNPARLKLTSMTLALVYLLLSAGGASTLVFCTEPDGYSHVEYNSVGLCGSKCDTSTTLSHGSIPTLSLKDGNISICRDVSLSQDIARFNFQKNFYNLSAISLSATGAPHFLPVHQIPVRLLHAPQPPPQALAALRTTVLLI
jgi:hypothetical protein